MNRIASERKRTGTVAGRIAHQTDYGLVKRVAQKLGISESYTTRVKNGKVENVRVANAINLERKIMKIERRAR